MQNFENSLTIRLGYIPHRKKSYPSLLLFPPLIFFLLLLPLSFSDPRVSESFLFCCAGNKTQPNNVVPNFVKEMETLSQLINTTHFATYHVNTSAANAAETPPIYGMAQCHHDLSQTDCLLCFVASRTKLPRCLPSPSAAIFLDGCFLRYDTYNFYREYDSPDLENITCSDDRAILSNYEIEREFVRRVEWTVQNLTRIGGKRGHAAVETPGFYGLAECWESVGRKGCRECLEKVGKEVISRCGTKIKREGRGMNAGCYLRYSNHKFFNINGEDSAHGYSATGITIAIALASSAFLMLLLFAAYAAYARITKVKKERKNLGLVTNSMKKYLNFKYETLEKATNYFNPSRKLGQGGAGSVFMGTLSNGETVAVKRLVFNTRQWVDEFFNEVNLISKIEHENLVKLLGCSIEGPDSLLVYEYVPNKSLDHFIFDKKNAKRFNLNWKQRLNIIVGTAEGLRYLHEGSETRIIHRDIKTSNILLDENLSPKIADFGLARCFSADQTHLSTGVAGTLGYMAPEYLIRGQLTEKADIYSFGILIIEIISGRRNTIFSENSIPLLQTVWNLYISNKLIEAVDCNLNDFPAEEACKVLQIALLCTQAAVALRPSMAQVVSMLTNRSCKIPIPNQPPYLNSSVLEAANSTRSYSTNSWVSNAATKITVPSYTSWEESSSAQSSEGNARK